MKLRVSEILADQALLSAELVRIQEQCIHPQAALKVDYKSSDGYAEKTQYWKNLTCGLCLKTWVEDQ